MHTFLKKRAALIVTALGVAAAPAFAGGGPYDAITTAVDFDTAVTAMGVVAAAVAVALIAKKGFRIVMGMIGG